MYKYFKDSISLIQFFFHKHTKKKKLFKPMPHTTRITNTKRFFLSHIFLTFCLLYYSFISIFLHTAHISSHFFFFQVSTPRFFFFLNNYKNQSILLVSQCLKLFWYLTNQVCYSRFWGYKSSILHLISPLHQQLRWTNYPRRPVNRTQRTRFGIKEIEPKELDLV